MQSSPVFFRVLLLLPGAARLHRFSDSCHQHPVVIPSLTVSCNQGLNSCLRPYSGRYFYLSLAYGKLSEPPVLARGVILWYCIGLLWRLAIFPLAFLNSCFCCCVLFCG